VAEGSAGECIPPLTSHLAACLASLGSILQLLSAACSIGFLPADVGVRVDGVAISWRNGQAFYVPLHRRPELVAALAPLFAAPGLEKATWDLRAQLAALARVLGRGALGIPGASTAGGSIVAATATMAAKRLCLCRCRNHRVLPSLLL
jgi:hypothetical protein